MSYHTENSIVLLIGRKVTLLVEWLNTDRVECPSGETAA